MSGQPIGIRQALLRLHARLSGRLTPPEDLRPPEGIQASLLPVADLFMILLLSRPPGGSLRYARVTPVTIVLSIAACLVVGGAGLGLSAFAITGRSWLLLVPGLLALGFGAGCAILAVFGIRQRGTLA